MRYLTLFYFLLFSPLFCNAQNLSFGLNYGIGTYWNESLKDLNREFLEDFPVEAKITENFPPYFYPELEILVGIDEKFNAGGSLRYMTSGARNYYEDYSGKLYSDLIINGYSISGLGEMLLVKKTKTSLSAYGRVSFIYNTMRLTSNLEVDQVTESSSTDFYSYNLGVESGINYKYLINKFFIKTNLGLAIDVPSKIFLQENSDYHLLNSAGNPVKINWSGIRFSMGIGFNI